MMWAVVVVDERILVVRCCQNHFHCFPQTFYLTLVEDAKVLLWEKVLAILQIAVQFYVVVFGTADLADQHLSRTFRFVFDGVERVCIRLNFHLRQNWLKLKMIWSSVRWHVMEICWHICCQCLPLTKICKHQQRGKLYILFNFSYIRITPHFFF